MAPSLCAFCQNQGLTSEHLWPKWVSRLLAAGRKTRFDTTLTRLYAPTRSWHSFDEMNLTANIPCAECNSGWMSRLEDSVIPLLSPMITGAEKTVMSIERQTLIAAWCVKMAMVFEYMEKESTRLYRRTERERFRESLEIPENHMVWLAHYRGDKYGCHHSSNPMIFGDLKAPHVGHCTTMAAGQLAIQVYSFRFRRSAPRKSRSFWMRPGPWESTLQQIWPPIRNYPIWPPNDLLTQSRFELFQARFYHGDIPQS